MPASKVGRSVDRKTAAGSFGSCPARRQSLSRPAGIQAGAAVRGKNRPHCQSAEASVGVNWHDRAYWTSTKRAE